MTLWRHSLPRHSLPRHSRSRRAGAGTSPAAHLRRRGALQGWNPASRMPEQGGPGARGHGTRGSPGASRSAGCEEAISIIHQQDSHGQSEPSSGTGRAGEQPHLPKPLHCHSSSGGGAQTPRDPRATALPKSSLPSIGLHALEEK